MNDRFDIAELIHKHFKGELTPDDESRFLEWLGQSDENKALFESLKDHQQALTRWEIYQQFDAGKAWQAMQAHLEKPKVITLHTRLWRYAAAILLPILAVGAVVYILQESAEPLAGVDDSILPGKEQATLILADGSEVELVPDQSTKTIAQEGTKVTNQNKTIRYESITHVAKPLAVVYNVLKTPTGGTYQLELADGTRVTLNAESSLRYPVSFSDSTRTVHLSGEAYFEVTHTGSPFVVQSESQRVQVLGTEFNVMAYANETLVQTTLVEGSVQVETNSQKRLLKPGQQAVLEAENLEVSAVDTQKYTAWKSGKFQFNNASMDEVMRRLARWYSFEYEFENEQSRELHFTGRIDNRQKISGILKMLEATTTVRFEYTDKRIIIQ